MQGDSEDDESRERLARVLEDSDGPESSRKGGNNRTVWFHLVAAKHGAASLTDERKCSRSYN